MDTACPSLKASQFSAGVGQLLDTQKLSLWHKLFDNFHDVAGWPWWLSMWVNWMRQRREEKGVLNIKRKVAKGFS